MLQEKFNIIHKLVRRTQQLQYHTCESESLCEEIMFHLTKYCGCFEMCSELNCLMEVLHSSSLFSGDNENSSGRAV